MNAVKFDINLKNVIFIIAVLVFLGMLVKLQPILATFGVSFFIAYLFDPLADRIENMGIRRSLAVFAIFFIMILIIILVLGYLIPVVYDEFLFLIKKAPEYTDKLVVVIADLAEKAGVDVSYENIKNLAIGRADEISKYTMKAVGGIFSGAGVVVSFLVNIGLVPILVFYFLKDYDCIQEKLFNVVRKKSGKDYTPLINEFNVILSRYFRGQVLVAAILGVLYTVVLLLAGIKPAILLGLVAGVFSIVPYLGLFIGAGSALIMAIVQYGDIAHPLYVIIGFVIVQLLEGNVITPKIVGESLGLHPAAVILALMVGGYLLGIGGMILALPVAAFIKVVGSRYLDGEDIVKEDAPLAEE